MKYDIEKPLPEDCYIDRFNNPRHRSPNLSHEEMRVIIEIVKRLGTKFCRPIYEEFKKFYPDRRFEDVTNRIKALKERL